jgi:hypothetical protein
MHILLTAVSDAMSSSRRIRCALLLTGSRTLPPIISPGGGDTVSHLNHDVHTNKQTNKQTTISTDLIISYLEESGLQTVLQAVRAIPPATSHILPYFLAAPLTPIGLMTLPTTTIHVRITDDDSDHSCTQIHDLKTYIAHSLQQEMQNGTKTGRGILPVK